MLGVLETIIAVVLFLLVLAVIIWLRSKFPKLEIKTSDLTVAVVVIALWLLLTGKITKFQLGDLNFETIFAQAAGAKVAEQVAKVEPLPVHALRTVSKGRVEHLPEALQQKSEAISFQLGYDGYAGSAIRDYLTLTQEPHLRYLIFNDAKEKFAALADARATQVLFVQKSAAFSEADLAQWISSNDLASLSRLPGFMKAADAVLDILDKKEVLERMEKLGQDQLPVVDKDGKFVGIVERARLTASLILDISNRLQKSK
jgi:signal-transduction protein with cAMP-binding, CBS, and nucleotidyltransferase domain